MTTSSPTSATTATTFEVTGAGEPTDAAISALARLLLTCADDGTEGQLGADGDQEQDGGTTE